MSAFATKQKPPRQDLDAFTTNVFSSTDNQINISDVIGLQGSLSSKIGSADTITLTNKTIDGDDNTIQDLTIASTTNLQSTLDNKLSLNANYSTSGVGFYSNGLKLGSNSSSNFFLLKDTNAPSGYSVSGPLVTIPSTGFMLQDYNSNEFMFIDRTNHRISIGKQQEQNTKQYGISINTTGLNTWTDSTSTSVDLTFLESDIVLAANTPQSNYSGNDGNLYPCIPRTSASSGGFYVKPIRTDATNKSLTQTNANYPQAQSNYIFSLQPAA